MLPWQELRRFYKFLCGTLGKKVRGPPREAKLGPFRHQKFQKSRFGAPQADLGPPQERKEGDPNEIQKIIQK